MAGCVVVAAAVVYVLARPTATPTAFGYKPITNDGRQKENTIVTDGEKIYFPELTPSGWIIADVETAGGEVKSLANFFGHPAIQDLSRSRSEFLILDPVGVVPRPGLWAMPLRGGAPRRVGAIMADAAAWAPDGNSIVYAEGGELFRCNPDGSEFHKFASLPGSITNIHWSPNGQMLRLALGHPDQGSEKIWEIGGDGTSPHPLFPDWHEAGSQEDGQWTPDGKYFLFDSSGGPKGDLWALAENAGFFGRSASQPVKLTSSPLSVESWAPSVDGKRAFLLERGYRWEVLRYARRRNQFVPYQPGVSAFFLDVARDGRWVAYSDSPDSSLWISRADGSQAVQLTFPPMEVELPRWSPDGKWIAFTGIKHRDDTWRVYLIPAQGGECRAVMPTASPQGAPTWSPDGKRLAFGDLADSRGAFPNSTAIHIVDVASHTATVLPGSNGLWTARWSPDGLHMAAITTDTKTLKVFDFRTSEWQELASAGSINDLNWSPKGDAVYFIDTLPASHSVIYRVRLQDRKVEKVATLMGNNPIRSTWFGITPDDSILVSNSVGTSEIYSLNVDLP